MSAYFTAIYELAKARTCVVCERCPCRVAESADGKLEADVMCHACFERAPWEYKTTSAQDVFRRYVKAGAHLKIAERAAFVAGERDLGRTP